MEIFASGLSVCPHEDVPEVTVIQGKDWEGNTFRVFLNPEETQSLLVQLGFYATSS